MTRVPARIPTHLLDFVADVEGIQIVGGVAVCKTLELTTELLDDEPSGPDARSELVEYSRLLGLKLFSEGELTQAQDLWQKALLLDPSNQKIQEYLTEVDQRLKSLQEIKSKDDG